MINLADLEDGFRDLFDALKLALAEKERECVELRAILSEYRRPHIERLAPVHAEAAQELPPPPVVALPVVRADAAPLKIRRVVRLCQDCGFQKEMYLKAERCKDCSRQKMSEAMKARWKPGGLFYTKARDRAPELAPA